MARLAVNTTEDRKRNLVGVEASGYNQDEDVREGKEGHVGHEYYGWWEKPGGWVQF